MEKKLLTDEEVLALDRILVENNEKIIGLQVECGYFGVGGSNSAPYTEEFNVRYTLEKLAGQPPLEEFGVSVVAIVNDVVYLVRPNNGRGEVITFEAGGRYTDSYGIAYDTVRGCCIGTVLKQD